MKYFSNFFLGITISLTFLFSCKKEEKKSVNNFGAYIGGKINYSGYPYILLLKNQEIKDTLFINEKDEFGKKFDVLTPGMYTLNYGSYHQYVYFDKNDSIFLKLDVNGFKSSTSFYGKGSDKNNFLIELFNLTDEDHHNCSFLFLKNAKKFKISADSLRDSRRAYYLRKKTELGWDKDFDEYARAIIDYSYYKNLETYPIVSLHHRTDFTTDSLPFDYYNFRNKIDYNKENLADLPQYIQYLSTLLNGIAQKSNIKKETEQEIYKLKIADSLLSNQKIKNKVTTHIVLNYLKKYYVLPKNYLNEYIKINNDTLQKEQIATTLRSIDQFNKSKKLPTYELTNIKGEKITLNKNKYKSLLFFWSSDALKLYDKRLKQMDSLIHKYPQWIIYSINTDKDVAIWKKNASVQNNHIINLYASNFEDLKEKWVILSLKRVILLNENGAIKNDFIDIDDKTQIKN